LLRMRKQRTLRATEWPPESASCDWVAVLPGE
jgi:hypothetical protein